MNPSPVCELNAFVDTDRWCAPELCEGRTYNKKVDVYSFAVVLWEMLHRWATGEYLLPFASLDSWSIDDAILKGSRPTIPSCTPKAVIRVVVKCWEPDPNDRLDFKAVIRILTSVQQVLTFQKTNVEGRLYSYQHQLRQQQQQQHHRDLVHNSSVISAQSDQPELTSQHQAVKADLADLIRTM